MPFCRGAIAKRFNPSPTQVFAVLAAILALAAGLRLYGIETAPPGLYLDEAADGANAVQAWESGAFKVFYPEDNGREGLYINLASISIHFFGSTAWAVRLPANIFGILTVLGIYALAAELFSPVVGLAAAFFLATSYWHVNFSRIAFRAIAAPFFLVWALYLLLLAFRKLPRGRGYTSVAALAGAVYGLGFHTYLAYRITPLIAMLVLGLLYREASKNGCQGRYWIAASLFATTAMATVCPLAAYAIGHPDLAGKRMNQVSVFQSAHPAAEIVHNIWTTVGMLYWKGDGNPRHNYAHNPEVFWPGALLMTLGIAIAVRKLFAGPLATALPEALPLLWIVCGAIPAILSNESLPHALRSILMLPPVAILAAVGLARVLDAVPSGVSNRTVLATIALAACALTLETAHTYFAEWAVDPETSRWFDPENARLAAQMNALPARQLKIVAIQGTAEAADPFYLPLISLRFLTRTVTPKQLSATNTRFYTPSTFLSRLPGVENFCSEVQFAMPDAVVLCPTLR